MGNVEEYYAHFIVISTSIIFGLYIPSVIPQNNLISLIISAFLIFIMAQVFIFLTSAFISGLLKLNIKKTKPISENDFSLYISSVVTSFFIINLKDLILIEDEFFKILFLMIFTFASCLIFFYLGKQINLFRRK